MQIAELELRYVELPKLVEHTITLPLNVNVLPGDEAAGRVRSPEVEREKLLLSVQNAKLLSEEALRKGDRDGARMAMTSAYEALSAAPMADALVTGEAQWFAQSIELLDERGASYNQERMSASRSSRARGMWDRKAGGEVRGALRTRTCRSDSETPPLRTHGGPERRVGAETKLGTKHLERPCCTPGARHKGVDTLHQFGALDGSLTSQGEAFAPAVLMAIAELDHLMELAGPLVAPRSGGSEMLVILKVRPALVHLVDQSAQGAELDRGAVSGEETFEPVGHHRLLKRHGLEPEALVHGPLHAALRHAPELATGSARLTRRWQASAPVPHVSPPPQSTPLRGNPVR